MNEINKKILENDSPLCITPQCFKLPNSAKSKVRMEIKNIKSYPVYFKMYTSNIHAIRFQPTEGCIQSHEQISVDVYQKASEHPVRQHEEIFVTTYPFPELSFESNHLLFKPHIVSSKEMKEICKYRHDSHLEISKTDNCPLCANSEVQTVMYNGRNTSCTCDCRYTQQNRKKVAAEKNTLKERKRAKSNVDTHVLARVININRNPEVEASEYFLNEVPELRDMCRKGITTSDEDSKRKLKESQRENEEVSVTIVQKSPKREGIVVTVSPTPNRDKTENEEYHSKTQKLSPKIKFCEETYKLQENSFIRISKETDYNCLKSKTCHGQYNGSNCTCFCNKRYECFKDAKKPWVEEHSLQKRDGLENKGEQYTLRKCKCQTIQDRSYNKNVRKINTDKKLNHQTTIETVSEDAQSGAKNVRIIAYPTVKANGKNGIKGKELDPEESSKSSASSVEEKNKMNKKKFKQKRMVKRLETRCKNIQRMVQGSFYIHLLILLMVIGAGIFGIVSRRQTEWSIPCFYQHFLPY